MLWDGGVPSLNSMYADADVHRWKNWRTLLYCVSELGTGGWRRGATLTFLAAETRPGHRQSWAGTAESSRAQPRHPHHPPHTPTPGTLSIYTFRWLLLRCIFIALAKVNKCNHLDLNPNPFLSVTYAFLKKWKRKFRRIFITQLCNLNIEVNVIIVVG